ncbi:MAG TPA: glycosyltransferase family 39 protein, partial [Roseiflexaceae bacterium]|nr:glycosyltransferase family 39 protein [Roseiflexaceae bacterium]
MSRQTLRQNPHILPLLLLLIPALLLRLAVWHWHELFPLSGDEQEYLAQALTLLRERQYVELQLMRPPLYTIFLAGCIYMLDSLIQQLRLVQAIISTLTFIPIYAIAWELWRSRRIAVITGMLFGLNMTLAVTATELLSETLFLFGLCVVCWLLLRARAGRYAVGWALAAGIALGALILIRSVALPLLPLAGLWLLLAGYRQHGRRIPFLMPAIALGCGVALLLVPWAIRNTMTYGGLIVVDTTGAENLWLDNDPAGREAVKAQLYALGDDRLARQQLATAQGMAVITADPQRFAAKAFGEALEFFALQYTDDMLTREEIWLSPAEVWLRLLLGDGLWLLILLAGSSGMWRAPPDQLRPDLRWILVPWCLYTLATAMLFHVELRYRLPVYPALAPYAAWQLLQLTRSTAAWRSAGALISLVLLVALTIAYRPYPTEAWRLANKHVALWRGEAALTTGALQQAEHHAAQALVFDPQSAWAYTISARAALLAGDPARAAATIAFGDVYDHPYAHVLRGIARRELGDLEGARADLAYETASREALQQRLWGEMPAYGMPPAALAIGDGLDLGFVRGFHPADQAYRWSGSEAQIRLALPPDATRLVIRLAAQRPAGVAPPQVGIAINGQPAAQLRPDNTWRDYP